MPIISLSSVNEKQTSYIALTFKDEVGAAITPTSITWTLNDLLSGAVLGTGTITSPGTSTYTLEILPAYNIVVNTRTALEEHVLTISAPYQASKAVTGDYHFNVANLEFLT